MLSKFSQRIKGSFVTGILVSAPIFITIGVFYYVFSKIDSFLGGLFQYFITLPNGKRIPGLGLVALIIMVFFVGELTRWYLGKKLLKITESVFVKIPVLRVLYNALKQIGHYIMVTRQKPLFRRVVLTEWPNDKSYILGFLTDSCFEEKGDDDRIPIYIPTAPNPTSGYLLYVKKRHIKITNLTIEEGMRIVLSAGIVQDPTKYITTPQPDKGSV